MVKYTELLQLEKKGRELYAHHEISLESREKLRRIMDTLYVRDFPRARQLIDEYGDLETFLADFVQYSLIRIDLPCLKYAILLGGKITRDQLANDILGFMSFPGFGHYDCITFYRYCFEHAEDLPFESTLTTTKEMLKYYDKEQFVDRELGRFVVFFDSAMKRRAMEKGGLKQLVWKAALKHGLDTTVIPPTLRVLHTMIEEDVSANEAHSILGHD